MLLALPITLSFRRPLIMLLFAFGQPDFELDAAARVMQVERYERVSRALHAADEPADFRRVEKELARARRIGMHVRRCSGERRNVTAGEPDLGVVDDDVRFLELHAAGTYGLDLPALERDAGFIAFLDEIVVERLFVLYDAHGL